MYKILTFETKHNSVRKQDTFVDTFSSNFDYIKTIHLYYFYYMCIVFHPLSTRIQAYLAIHLAEVIFLHKCEAFFKINKTTTTNKQFVIVVLPLNCKRSSSNQSRRLHFSLKYNFRLFHAFKANSIKQITFS